MKYNFGADDKESRAIALKDKIVSCAPTALRKKLLEKEMSVDEMVKTVKVFQHVEKVTEEMKDKQKANVLDVNRVTNRKPKPEARGECFRCGREGHIANDCPAHNRKCDKCGREGHFAVKCQTKKRSYGEANRYSRTGKFYK